MLEVRQTDEFSHWLARLRDLRATQRIVARVRRLGEGNPGRHRRLEGGVTEMKVDYGPGYRVYYTLREKTVVILLCGGDKRTQTTDIRKAQAMAKEM